MRPWKPPSKAITAGRFVYERANLIAFSTASVPALKNAAFAGPRERRELDQPLGERHVDLVGDDREVGVREALELLLRGRDDARVRVADVEAADAAGEVDERVAVDVGERGAAALGGDDREVDRERGGDERCDAGRESPASAGPGTAVRRSIVRVIAMPRTIAKQPDRCDRSPRAPVGDEEGPPRVDGEGERVRNPFAKS